MNATQRQASTRTETARQLAHQIRLRAAEDARAARDAACARIHAEYVAEMRRPLEAE